jgi:hypothetical protein
VDTSELITALSGAIAGGAAATLGGAWAKRLELRRAHRVELYNDALPALVEYLERAEHNLSNGSPMFDERMPVAADRIYRLAVLTRSKGDRCAAAAVSESVREMFSVIAPAGNGPINGDFDGAAAVQKPAVARLRTRIEEAFAHFENALD